MLDQLKVKLNRSKVWLNRLKYEIPEFYKKVSNVAQAQ